jgi:hypothetical protein
MDAEITRVEVERFLSPQRPFRLLDEDDGRCGMVVHSALKVNGAGWLIPRSPVAKGAL